MRNAGRLIVRYISQKEGFALKRLRRPAGNLLLRSLPFSPPPSPVFPFLYLPSVYSVPLTIFLPAS